MFVGDVFVFGAVDAEGGGGEGGDPVDGAGEDVFAAFGVEVSAEEQGEDFCGVDAFAVGFGEVAGAEEVDDAGDGAGLVEVAFAFELLDACRDAEELGEVAAGGTAGGADAGGVDVIFGGVGAQPADGGLAIVHGGGEGEFGGEAVGDGDGDVAVLGEDDAEFVVGVARTGAEAPAVNAEDGGEGAGGVFGAGEIELEVGVVGVGVFEVGFEEDVVGDGEVGGEGGGGEEEQGGEEGESMHGVSGLFGSLWEGFTFLGRGVPVGIEE